MNRAEAYTQLWKLANLELDEIDVSLYNGALRSGKEMHLESSPSDVVGEIFPEHCTFYVWHRIDDTNTRFSFEEAIEVLMGLRDVHDGECFLDAGKRAEEITEIVIAELFEDRRGLTQEWANIGEDIQEEIREVLREKIMDSGLL
jgi:hypothetical protein